MTTLLSVLILAPGVLAGDPPEDGEAIERKLAGREVWLWRVERHHGSVAVETETGDPEDVRQVAAALADLYFGETGFLETALRELAETEISFEEEHKSRSRSRDREERAGAEDYAVVLLDAGVLKEIRRSLDREERKPDEERRSVIAKPKRLEVEIYRDPTVLAAVIPFTESAGARYGVCNSDVGRAYLKRRNSMLVTRLWGAELCAQHLVNHYLAGKDIDQHHPVAAALAEWLSYHVGADPEFDILTVQAVRLRRSTKPGIYTPSVREFLSVRRAPGQVRNYPYFAPLFLEFLRETREPLFYRLITGLNGKIRGLSSPLEFPQILELLHAQEQDWPAWEREFESWQDTRYEKANQTEHRAWERGVFDDE